MGSDLWHIQSLAWKETFSEKGWNPGSGSERDELSTGGVEMKGFWKCWRSAPKWFNFLAIACTDIGKKLWKGKRVLQEQRRMVLRIDEKMLNWLHRCFSSNAEINAWVGFPLVISQSVCQRPREILRCGDGRMAQTHSQPPNHKDPKTGKERTMFIFQEDKPVW